MFDVFDAVRNFLKVSPTNIDNTVFKLHYKVTLIFLVTSSLMVTAQQYIGNPIYCTCPIQRLRPVMDSFCWVYSTYTDMNVTGKIGTSILQPGVAHHYRGESATNWKYHKYYQWVCFTLFFQAMFFYVPRYLWKIWEKNLVLKLSQHLRFANVNKEEQLEQTRFVVGYLYSSIGMHDIYALKFFFCEMLNFANIVGQIYITNILLGGEFLTYGWRIMTDNSSQEHTIDPMSKVFPKMTMCTYYQYGPSGDIMNMENICVLPLNLVNEKVYIFLWFWFIFLTFVSFIGLLYRSMVVSFRSFRCLVLRARSYNSQQIHVEIVSNRCSIGDWFLLNQLGKNIDPRIFRNIIVELANKFDHKNVL